MVHGTRASTRAKTGLLVSSLSQDLLRSIFFCLPACPDPPDGDTENRLQLLLTGTGIPDYLRTAAATCRAWCDAVCSLVHSNSWQAVHLADIRTLLLQDASDDTVLTRLEL